MVTGVYEESGESPTSEEGLLDKMVRAEEKLPQVARLASEYGVRLNRYGEVVPVRTEQIGKANSFGQRLALARSLAQEMDPIAEESSRISGELRDTVNEISPGITSAIRMIDMNSTTSATDRVEIQKFVTAIHDLAASGLEAAANVETLTKTIDEGKGLSKDLDGTLNKINSGLLLFVETRSHYKSWLDELERLG